MNIRLIFSLITAASLAGCTPQPDSRSNDEQRSFCYWETTYKPDNDLWKQTGANHLYVRYFDVDWDIVSAQPLPIASVNTTDSLPMHFTPSVFLTNRVFEKSSEQALDSLSARIKRRVDGLTGNFGYRAYYARKYDHSKTNNYDSIQQTVIDEYRNRYKEILIDCDWTEGTKDKFFYFVKRMKKDFDGKDISVTLRLWQYKQTNRAGVPPVDRCLLMCYNMQMANDFKVHNSIASLEELKKFVSGDKYPLTLDVALPIFNWAVLFRNEKMIGLLGNADEKSYADNFIEYQNMGNGKYRMLTDKVIGNYFARKGDIVRVEAVSKELLNEMANYLKSEIPMDEYSRVTFFSWNKTYINNYGTDEIKNIYSLFNK